MAELPDDATEAATKAVEAVIRGYVNAAGSVWLPSAGSVGWGATPSEIGKAALAAAYPLIAARVRAEAVADERQATYERLLDAAQGAMNEERRLQLVQFVVNNFASVGVAGSVPVATPERYAAGHAEPCTSQCAKPAGITCAEWGCLPVATPPAKGTKSAAELVREIARADPESHGQAVARGYGVGPAATPTGPEHCTFEQREDCPRHGSAASPVPAVQPEPWFRETPDSLAQLDAERAEVAAVEAAAEQPEER